MLIPKKNRIEVYKYLFKEGVLYAEKDFNLAKHPDLEVPNLQVIKMMQSFVSRGYVRESFAWRHYYWYLNNEGIEYLREYLGLPSDVVPATLKKAAAPSRPPMRPSEDRPRPSHQGGDREGYRPSGGFNRGAEKAGAPAGYQPGFGRGGV